MAFPNTDKSLALRQVESLIIELKVRHGATERRGEMLVSIRSTNPMYTLMDKVCRRWGSSREEARFFTDGVRIKPKDTAKSLEMENGDKIDFFTEQLGGRGHDQHSNDETFEQMDARQSIQALVNIAWDQIAIEEDAQFLPPVSVQPESQLVAHPSARDAEIEVRYTVSNEHMDQDTTRMELGVIQNISTEDNIPNTVQASQAELLKKVNGEKGGELTVYLKSDTIMRKVVLTACAHLGSQQHQPYLLHDGRRINLEDNPASCELKGGRYMDLGVESTRGAKTPQNDTLGHAQDISTDVSEAACQQTPRTPSHIKIRVIHNTGGNELEFQTRSNTPIWKFIFEVTGEKEHSTINSVISSLRSPQRSLDVHISFSGSNDLEKATFRIGTHQTMGLLMRHACHYMRVSKLSSRFMYEGQRLHGDDTPYALMMEDGDRIEVFWGGQWGHRYK